jgi:hypothetical protein
MGKLLVRYSRRRLTAVLLFVIVAAITWSALGAGAASAQPPATVLLIRHAEKPANGIDLAPEGFERAKRIPQLFGSVAPHNLPKPDFLFATQLSKNSNRPVETITPLSDALGLPISHDIADKDFAELAKELLSGKYAGKVILVAWHHGSLPGFARALGAVPPYDPWPETQFDRVWRIDFKNGKATLHDLPQGLLSGDSK